MEILWLLSDGQALTSTEVAEYLEIGPTNAATLLGRYTKNGEVLRYIASRWPKRYIYRIAERGLERLEFWSRSP